MPFVTNTPSPIEAFASKPPVLQGGIELHVDQLSPRHVLLNIWHEGHRAAFRAAYLSVPYPSGLRRLLAQEREVDAVLVERIPSGLATAAEESDVGLLDIRGHGRLVAPGFVYVVPPPPTVVSATARSSASPFAPKASRIVRALLTDPEQRWRVSRVADAVGVDVGNAHRILAGLVEMGLVERDEDFYVVSDPGSLLEAWADLHRRPKERISLPVADDLGSDLHQLLFALDGEAVVSGEFAAELRAPYLAASSAIVHCLTPAAWETLQLDDRESRVPALRPRARILVDLADAGVAQFSSIVDGVHVAHPVQIYVDLFREPGRGREAAEHLRREEIPY